MIELTPIAGIATSDVSTLPASEIASTVALNVGEASAIEAGVDAADAAATGAVAAAEAASTLSIAGALGTACSVIGVVAIPFVAFMMEDAQVTIDIENETDVEFKCAPYEHHGKRTAEPKNLTIPPTTSALSKINKVIHAQFAFAKKTAALYGTEGAILFTSPAGDHLSIGFDVPLVGDNGCGVSLQYDNAKDAWTHLIDNGNPKRVASASGKFEISAAMTSTSGGDIGMLVSIKCPAAV